MWDAIRLKPGRHLRPDLGKLYLFSMAPDGLRLALQITHITFERIRFGFRHAERGRQPERFLSDQHSLGFFQDGQFPKRRMLRIDAVIMHQPSER